MTEFEADAIIIGAGHNGLIAACYLARAGRKVLVLERTGTVGGACVTEEVWPGYRVSVGAYLCSLLQPQIIQDLRLRERGFEILRRETAGFAPFPDGSSLFLYSDCRKTRESLEQFCGSAEADAYERFEQDVERAAEIIEPWLGPNPPTAADLRDSFQKAGRPELYRQFITGSVRELLDARFTDDRLKTVLATDGLIGTYGGPSSPGTAYVLLHHYMGMATGSRGAWGYVRGGMGRITQLLAEALTEYGGTIRTDAAVQKILVEETAEGDRKATGIELESGDKIYAKSVLSNADSYRTFHQMLGEKPDGGWVKLKSQGGASVKINLAVTELPEFTCLPRASATHMIGAPRPEHLGTVHLCPSVEALEVAWDEASRGYPSTEPMIEMYLQTATDTTLTPPGKHILSLFVQYFPYNLASELNLDVEREKFADRVIAICSRYAPNVPGSILHRQVLTPRDLEDKFGLTGGHIFHGDLLPPTVFDGRNPHRLTGGRTQIRGLYLCGSGAHPGGCVFGAPGRYAAESVLAHTQ